MPEPRPSVTRFVLAVARVERARGGAAKDGDVALRVLARLHGALGKLVGAGFDVMLARSLVLARRDHPVLEGITVAPGGTLAGIDPGIDRGSRDGAALEQGTLAIVSQLLELLVVLVGEALAMRLVRDVWPGAAEEDNP